jgi:hypothetical protein
MLPYGLVKIQAPINAEPSKRSARQGSRREVAAEIELVARQALIFDDGEEGLISRCATCDEFLPCECARPEESPQCSPS